MARGVGGSRHGGRCPWLSAHRVGRYPSILLSNVGIIIFGFGTSFVTSFHQYLFFRFGVSQSLVGHSISSMALSEAQAAWEEGVPGGERAPGMAGLARLGGGVGRRSYEPAGQSGHPMARGTEEPASACLGLPGGAGNVCPVCLNCLQQGGASQKAGLRDPELTGILSSGLRTAVEWLVGEHRAHSIMLCHSFFSLGFMFLSGLAYTFPHWRMLFLLGTAPVLFLVSFIW